MGVLADWQIEVLCIDNHGAIRTNPMIAPYDAGQRKPGKISSGATSYGYDVRLGYKFKCPTGARLTAAVIDPKSPDNDDYWDTDLTPHKGDHVWDFPALRSHLMPRVCVFCGLEEGKQMLNECPSRPQPLDHIIIPPHSFVLGESIETFDIPRDILVVCLGKSTYARTGIIVNVTPGEPEWKGIWTIELSNTNPKPVKVYCGEGIMQAIFLRADGIYEKQAEPLLAKIHGTCRTSYLDKKGKYQNQAGLTLPTVDKWKT